MLFPTLNFGLFFLVVFTTSWWLRDRPIIRTGFLTAASYAFYAFWDWRFCGLLFGSSSLNWLCGQALYRLTSPGRRKLLVGLAVAANLTLLGYFKYSNFLIGAANSTLATIGSGKEFRFVSIVLPVGISFFTFHGISYVVDLYRGKLVRPANFLNMLLYLSFFPQLVAGPIVRAAHFLPQLVTRPDPRDIKATRAFLLILGGLFKKVVIANYLATDLVDDIFLDPSRYGALDLLLASYGYAVQIYCDFSAYTDIAIGIAALLGYRFPQNFDQPYRALGLRNFWERWHISLSSWLRDYLYIPLGGNTGGRRRHFINLALTMLLGGLWHGAAWNFVIWGGLHGGLLIGEHLLWPDRKILRAWPWWQKLLGIAVTFHLVCLTWIFFRASDLDHALRFLAGFTAIATPPTTATPFVLSLLALGMALQYLPRNRMALIESVVRYIPLPLQGALVGAAIIAIDALGPSGVAPFIYFQF
jgi:D-alanyl-lipoteichoic acid acyltransferase DltB (MBOAT superfamily)